MTQIKGLSVVATNAPANTGLPGALISAPVPMVPVPGIPGSVNVPQSFVISPFAGVMRFAQEPPPLYVGPGVNPSTDRGLERVEPGVYTVHSFPGLWRILEDCCTLKYVGFRHSDGFARLRIGTDTFFPHHRLVSQGEGSVLFAGLLSARFRPAPRIGVNGHSTVYETKIHSVIYRGREANPHPIDPQGSLMLAQALFEALPGRTTIPFELDPTEGPA